MSRILFIVFLALMVGSSSMYELSAAVNKKQTTQTKNAAKNNKNKAKQAKQAKPKGNKKQAKNKKTKKAPKKQKGKKIQKKVQKAPQKTAQKTNKVAQKQLSAYISTAPNAALDHIKDRHWFNANSGPATSHFSKNVTSQKLNQLATTTLNHGTQKAGNNGRIIHEYTFKSPIGTGTNGKPARTLRVVTDPNQSNGNSLHVVTAFPVN